AAAIAVMHPLLWGPARRADGWWLVAAFAAAGLAVWLVLRRSAEQTSAPALATALSIVATGTAAVLMNGGSQKLGQLAGALTAATAGLAIGAMPSRRVAVRFGGASLAVWIAVWGALLTCGYFWADVKAWDAAWLTAAA